MVDMPKDAIATLYTENQLGAFLSPSSGLLTTAPGYTPIADTLLNADPFGGDPCNAPIDFGGDVRSPFQRALQSRSVLDEPGEYEARVAEAYEHASLGEKIAHRVDVGSYHVARGAFGTVGIIANTPAEIYASYLSIVDWSGLDGEFGYSGTYGDPYVFGARLNEGYESVAGVVDYSRAFFGSDVPVHVDAIDRWGLAIAGEGAGAAITGVGAARLFGATGSFSTAVAFGTLPEGLDFGAMVVNEGPDLLRSGYDLVFSDTSVRDSVIGENGVIEQVAQNIVTQQQQGGISYAEPEKIAICLGEAFTRSVEGAGFSEKMLVDPAAFDEFAQGLTGELTGPQFARELVQADCGVHDPATVGAYGAQVINGALQRLDL